VKLERQSSDRRAPTLKKAKDSGHNLPKKFTDKMDVVRSQAQTAAA